MFDSVPNRTRLAAVLPVILAVIAAPRAAAAQQPPETTDTVPDRWDAAFDLGFTGSTGNTDLAVLTTAFRIKHLETERYELEWSVGYRYGESEGTVVARSIKSGLAYDLWPEADWSPFAFVDAERDPFRRLDLRTNAGAGVKRTLVRGANASLSVSTAVLHDYENFRDAAADGQLASRSNARWSVRGKGHRVIRSGVRVEHVTFFTPVWDDARDYNIESNTKATVLLTERVGVTFGYTFRRDSTPPPDVEHNDQIVQAGVTIQL